MNDSLKILIQGLLDTNSTEGNINSQIKKLQSKIDKIKIEFDFDEQVVKTLTDFSKAMEHHKEISKDLNKVMREEKTITKEANGVIKEKITQHLKSGEIIEKEIERINKKNKATKDEIKTEEKYLNVLEKSDQLQKKRIRENAKGVTGSTEKYKDGYSDITYKLNRDGNAISKETIINRDKEQQATEKLVSRQEELLRKLKQLQTQGAITSQTFEKMTNAVNTRDSVQQLDRLNKSINVLQRNSKRKTIVGENIGSNDGLKDLKNANEKLLIETLKANKVIQDQKILAVSVDRATGKWSITTKEGAREQRTLSGVIDKSTGSLYKQKEALSDVASRNLGMFEQMKVAMSRVPIWAGAMTAFYGTAAAGTDMIQNLLMIDQQMTELKRVMDSGTNFTQMLEDSVQMSKELGRNLQDVNNAIILAAKTGANAQDSLALAETSVIASNISELTAEEAMNNLITVTTQFNMAATESIDVINKLNEVDNNFATSTKDLSDSLARAGSVAKTYNITLDEMIGYTTAMQVATRASGAEVGNAMKTIVSRLSTNDSLTALQEVGIQIDDISNGSEILKKIGERWNTLSDAQKQNLGVTIAGRWQLAKFLGLFNNYQMSLDATKTSLNSQNSAIKENEKYLQSMEAKINTLKNSWIEFSIAMGNSGVSDIFGGIVIGLTKLAESGTVFVNQFGSLPAIFALATGGLLLFSDTFRKWTTTSKGISAVADSMSLFRDHTTSAAQLVRNQTQGMHGLQKATMATSIAWNTLGASMRAALMSTGVGIAVVGLSYAIGHLTTKFIEQKREQRELESTNKDIAKSYSSNKQEIDELVASYETLKSKQSSSSLNADEDKKLTDTQNRLNELLPVLTKNIDEKGNAHLRNVDAVQQEIKFAKELSKSYNAQTLEEFTEKVNKSFEKIKDLKSQIKELEAYDPGTVTVGGTVAKDKSSQKDEIKIGREKIQLEREIALEQEKLLQITKEKLSAYGEMENATKHLTEEDKKYIDTQIEKQKAHLKDEDSVLSLANKYADFQKVVNSLREMGGDKVSIGFLEGLSSEKTQALERFLSLTKEFGGDTTYFTRYLTEAGFTQSEVLMIVNDLKDGISDQSKEVDKAAKSYDNFKDSLSDSKKMMEDVNSVLGIGMSNDDIDNLRTLVNTMSILENQVNKTAEQEEYLANAQKYLAEQYPALVNGTEIRLDAVSAEIRANDVLLQATEKMSNGQMTYEEARTVTAASEANARVQIMNQELQALNKMLEEYAQAQMNLNESGAIAANGRIMNIYNKIKTIETDLQIEIPKRDRAIGDLGKIIDYTDEFTKSTDKNTKSQKNQIYVTDKYKIAIEKLNTELAKLKELQDDYPKWSDDYQKSLRREIDLLEKKKKLTNDQAYSLGQQIKSGKIQPKGIVDLGGGSTTSIPVSSSSSFAKGGSNASTIWNFFKSKGFSDAIVAGIMGNLQLESGLNPNALNKSSGAYGIAQWLGGRKTALQSFASSQGTNMNDLVTQLNFLWKELNSTEKRTMNYLTANQGASASTIAAAFDKLFERSEGTHIPQRQQYANNFLSQYAGSGGGGSVAVSSSSSGGGSNSAADMAQAVDSAKSDYQGLLQDIYSIEGMIQQLRFDLVTAELAEWEHKIERANVLLEAHELKLAKLDPTSKAYTDELKKQLNTLTWQQKSQNELAWRTEHAAKKAKGLTQEQREALMDRYYDEMNALNQIRNQVAEIQQLIVDTKINTWKEQFSDIETQLQRIEQNLSRFTPNSEAYRKELEKQKTLLEQQRKLQNEIVWFIGFQIKNNKNLTDAQRQEMKNRYEEELSYLDDVRNKTVDIINTIRQSEVESITDKLSKTTENLSDRREGVDRQANRVDEDDPERNKKLIGFYQQQIILAGQEKKEIQNTIKTLAAKRTAMQKAGEDITFINEQIKELEDSLTAIDDTEFDLKENLKDVYEEMADEIIDAYKEFHEKKYELDKQAIEDESKAFKKAHKDKMDLLDEELEKYQKIINAELESINREESQDSYDKEVATRQEEIQKTQNQINILGMDDSREAQTKRAKLEEELKKQQLDLAELVHDREVELRRQNLQDELKTKEELIKTDRDKNDEELEKFEELQDDKLEAVDQAYEDLINNEQYWSDMRRDIIAGELTNMGSDIMRFQDIIHDNMSKIGDSISNNLISKLEKAMNLLLQIDSGGSLEDVVSNPNPSTKPNKLTEADIQLMASKFIESQIIPKVKEKNVKEGLQGRVDGLEKSAISNGTLLDTNASYGTLFSSLTDPEKLLFAKYIQDVVAKGIGTESVKTQMTNITSAIAKEVRSKVDPKLWSTMPFLEALMNYQSFDTGGMTKGNGFAMLHDKEIVLNDTDTPNLLEAVKITRSFADVFKNFKMPNITPQLAGVGGDIHVNVHIDNMNGTRKEAENVFSVVANKLRGLGVK